MHNILTFVDAHEMSTQFEYIDGVQVVEARLCNVDFENVFEVDILISHDTRLGAIGALLLYLNSFAFDFLNRFSRAYPTTENVIFYLECDDVSNFWDLKSSYDFALSVADRSIGREFFSLDGDHRFMSREVAEDWVRPDKVRVTGKAVGVDGAFGTKTTFFEFEYEETLLNWLKTNPKSVELEPYELRLRRHVRPASC